MNKIICRNIINTVEGGIIIETPKTKKFICFRGCAMNFSLETGNVINRCVAIRDISTLSYVFYTQPKTKVFFKNNCFNNFFVRKSATTKFTDLQQIIIDSGYTSYDLS